jgi:hypothetical protein
VIRYLLEARIAVHPGIWILPGLLAFLRLAGAIWPEGWLPALESVYPITYPLLTFSLLEQEKRWHTLEVLVATPRCKASVLLLRLLAVVVPLFCTATAAARPGNWLLVLAPGIILGAVALLIGLLWEEEIGLTVALAWWGISFTVSITQGELIGHPVANWFLLILLPAPLAPEALLLRKWAHLGTGLFLFLLCVLIAGKLPKTVARK